MKISKRMRKWCVPVLAGLLALPCLNLLRSEAAGGIDLDEPCSLTVSVNIGAAGTADGNQAYLEDFNRMEIPVAAYRVADVDVTGQKFTPVEGFEGMDFDGLSPKRDVTAARWAELAKEADGLRTENGVRTDRVATVKKEEGDVVNAQAKITGLTPGLYLVVPETVYNPEYTVQYQFTPYLTALPSSLYTLTGEGSDEWVYETEIGLKPEAVQQYGNLNIVKHLSTYNPALGQATFVFELVGRDASGTVRYEDYVAMDYRTGGDQTLTVTGIPAGCEVTVTEVYSGASYEIVGSDTDAAHVWSEQAIAAGVPGAQTAAVDFTNEYNGGNRGGYGVTNHFEADGEDGWTWENPTTPLPSE